VLELRTRDWIILCSDGLTSELDDAAIATELGKSQTPQAGSERLLDAALAHGGRDNISVIVVPARVSMARSIAGRRGQYERSTLVWLAALAGAALAVLVVFVAKHSGLLN
jgi:serine/threonine protein phosphatase PrpC